MSIKKEKTKKGLFYFETGNSASRSNKFEDFYSSRIPKNKKWEIVWELFKDFHLKNGYKESELRLDRTVIEFGRKKS